MSAQTVSLAPINDTDANFRLWGKTISDQMIAGGWVKTGDTSQINWATVLKPASTSTVQGYEIFTSNDGGTNHAILVKIEYASASGSASTPAIWVTVGFTSNGSGSLTGNTTTRTLVASNSNSATLLSSYVAAGTGWASLILFSSAGTNYNIGFSIERTKGSSLTDQDEVLLCLINGGGSLKSQILNYSTGAYPMETSPNAQAIINTVNGIQSGSSGLSLQFGQKGGLTNSSANWFGSATSLIGSVGTTVTFSVYGVSHTYILNGAGAIFSAQNSTVILSRYE